ncbi:PREDICTED: GDT1-like protein 2, chloroplastic [Tarenaya hassleriana]|uniref:GDT1-like protein 2, chloroplastic n=1 Tax=Tarenaya hassleriana TaxID=28532 RepID=UPI00053C75FD|nr:PREDICTED: GDT1-like protein 2, chloroplastic [Tarenaya hassleriana]
MGVVGVSSGGRCGVVAVVPSGQKPPLLSVIDSLSCPYPSIKPRFHPLRCRGRPISETFSCKFRVHASNSGVGSGSYGGEEDGPQSSSIGDQSHDSSFQKLKPPGWIPYPLSVALVLISCGLVFSIIAFVKGGPSSVLAAVAKSGFTAAFSLIFVSEIGDKTFFIAALLAMQYEKTLVLLGSMGALSLMTVLSVVIGKIFQSVPAQFQTTLPIGEYAAVALLVFFGLKSIKDAWDIPPAEAKNGKKGGQELDEFVEAEELVKEKVSKRLSNPFEILWKSFSLVFFAEWGDRSMLATIALGAAQSAWGVAGGAIAGHFLATALAVVGGAFLANYISEKLVGYLGGALFLGFAAATFFGFF